MYECDRARASAFARRFAEYMHEHISYACRLLRNRIDELRAAADYEIENALESMDEHDWPAQQFETSRTHLRTLTIETLVNEW